MSNQNEFASLLQKYFYHNLIQQRNCSNKTIESYRDTFRLLFRFAEQTLHKKTADFCIEDLNAVLVTKFLNHLESERKNSIKSRNARLAAIHSFFRYISYEIPSALATIQQVLSIPMKRFTMTLVGFLTHEEINAIITAPLNDTWSGRRDHVLLATMYNTGARVSEIIHLSCGQIQLKRTSAVYLHGKGRKERVIPLWENTVSLIQQWLPQINSAVDKPLFPNQFGTTMTRSGVEDRLQLAVKIAQKKCSSLKNKKVSTHIIRHTTAIHLLESGVDLTVIALWLGHESIVTTHHYMEADLKMKRQVLNSIRELKKKNIKYQPNDKVLAFLDSL